MPSPPPSSSPHATRFTRRIEAIEPSVTLALDARAKARQAAGEDVVNMAVGEPDFPPPAAATEAALALLRADGVRYTPTAGRPSLRAAVAESLAATYGGAWEADQVCVCHSAKHALAGTLLALVEEGDEVLIPTPAWVSYFDQARLTGATPVAVPTRADADGFHLDLAAIERALTSRTRLVMLNSPNNPSGAVFDEGSVRALTSLCVERGLWLLSDEIYRRLVFDGVRAASPAEEDRARALTLLVDGASKAYAMTGYRIGFVAGPRDVVAAVAKLHSQTNGAPNALGQAAYEAALRCDPPEVEDMRRAFEARRDHLLAGFSALGIETPRPRGAFYAFPNLSPWFDGRGSVGLCEDLLEAERLAVVPGEAFGTPEHVRFSYALSVERIDEALVRLRRFLDARARR